MSNLVAINKSLADTYPHTPAAAVAAGDVVVINGRVFAANSAIAANVPGSVVGQPYTECAFAKATGAGTAIAVGQRVFWDTATSKATLTASNTAYLIGRCTVAAATTDSTVLVSLDSQAPEILPPLETGTTTAYTLTEADHGRTITNIGSTGTTTFTLPSAPRAGIRYAFLCPVNQDIRVDPGASDGIYMTPNGGSFGLQADGKYARLEAHGDRLVIESDSAGNWQLIDQTAAVNIEA